MICSQGASVPRHTVRGKKDKKGAPEYLAPKGLAMSRKNPPLPHVFIGSSGEGKTFAKAIKANLESPDVRITIWCDIFDPNRSFLDSLLQATKEFDYAIMVLTFDDVVTTRGEQNPAIRDNIYFEFGLFLAAFGGDRVFPVCAVNDPAVFKKISSDLLGITLLPFRPPEDREDFDASKSALETTCALIKPKLSARRRKPQCCVVFISEPRSSFHRGLQIGLCRELGSEFALTLHDSSRNKALRPKDLTTFVGALDDATRLKSDFVVIVPPCQVWWDDSHVIERVRTLATHSEIVVIENPPRKLDRYKAKLTTIVSDSNSGARVVCKRALRLLQNADRKRPKVLLLNGPDFSENAQQRAVIMRTELKKSRRNQRLELRDLTASTWTKQEAHLTIRRELKRDEFDLIICGNDDMALGAVEAISEHQADLLEQIRIALPSRSDQALAEFESAIRRPAVLGYDGIGRALHSIADPSSPFAGTVSIAPSTYGEFAARQIKELWTGGRCSNSVVTIPIGDSNFVDRQEAAYRLEESETWDGSVT